jgi:endothelin-converting enzyme/putative endopeptidase
MDEARIDAAGVTPARPMLDEIAGLADMAAVQKTIGRLHDMSVNVPFGLFAASDNHEPTLVVAHLYAAGLGLPDRDYYVKTEPRFVEARDKYKEHVAATFKLAGYDEARAKAAAETVFSMEKALAENSLDNVALRDPQATDHKTTFAGLQKLAPRFDWPGYFDEARLPQVDMNVREPKFLQEVDRQLAQVPLGDWKTYLSWHLLREAAPSLSKAFVEEDFRFNSAYLQGAKEMKPRWKRCVESTDGCGKAPARRTSPPLPARGHAAQSLVKNLLLGMGETIRGSPDGPAPRRRPSRSSAPSTPRSATRTSGRTTAR